MEWGMVLAAGLGTRFMPLTSDVPKPLIDVEGIVPLANAIANLREVGIENIIVNVHHKAEMIEDYLRDENIYILYEPELLETGGGIMNAIRKFGIEEMVVMVSDIILLSPGRPVLAEFISQWRPEMEMLVLTQHYRKLPQFTSVLRTIGDFHLAENDHFIFDPQNRGPQVFLGAYVLKGSLFSDRSEVTTFSMLDYLKKSDLANHLHIPYYCHEYDGIALEMGSPELLASARDYMRAMLRPE